MHLTRSIPGEIASIQVSGAAVTSLAWAAATSGGTPVTYEVGTGALSQLRSSGTFDAGTCLASSLVSRQYVDARPTPPVGDGYYYLGRARNACFAGSYGSTLRDQHGMGAGEACP